MKKIGLLAAAAAVMIATPAAAEGYLGARYSTGSLDSGGTDVDFDVIQGEGAFGWNSGGWGGQFGGAFGNVETDTTDDDFLRLDGHLYWDGSGWRIGGVVATTQLDDTDIEEWVYGVEVGFGGGTNVQWWGALTAGNIETGGFDYDTWNADLGLDFYSSPNVRFGGTVGFGEIDDADIETTTFGINGEFQPWSAPISIYAGWQMVNAESGGVDADSNSFSIGARWNFGGGTLQDRNNALPFRTNTQYAGRLFDLGPK
jgi:hypothetical protein